MTFKKKIYILFILVIYSLLSGIPVFAQEVTDVTGTLEASKTAIILVPLTAKDVPSYIPMIADRLFDSKLDKTKAYTIFNQDEFSAILNEKDIELPNNITKDIALQIGQKLEMDQVLFGVVSKENNEFIIKTLILDVASAEIISKGSEKASNIKGIEEAVGKLTRDIVKTVLPEEVVGKAVESLDSAEQTTKEENVQESISEFEKIAEEDPDKAIEMVAEPVREALKDTVRDEIVDEEIQVLYDKEKADKKRVWQFWTVIGLESTVQVGNIFGAASLDSRLESLPYWSSYMNSIFIDDPYRSYKDALESSQGTQAANYLLTGGANFGLAYAYKHFPDDLFAFTSFGRQAFAISDLLNISGYMASTASSQLGFYAQRKYLEYSTATTDFTEKYEDYRSAYIWPMIAEYSQTGLWTLGIAGMVTAALLPGEKTPMILSEKSRKYLIWGQTLLSVGNLTSGMATNFRGKAEDEWIIEHSSSGTIGDSTYLGDYITSQVLYYSTYAIYLGSAVLTYIGLSSGNSGSEDGIAKEDSTKSNLSFSILPADNGITAVARLRLD